MQKLIYFRIELATITVFYSLIQYYCTSHARGRYIKELPLENYCFLRFEIVFSVSFYLENQYYEYESVNHKTLEQEFARYYTDLTFIHFSLA